jgi:ornithine cyclodeaminase/alanine dehydrogenase
VAILLNRADVQQLLDMPSTIEILERAFAELAGGNVNMPQRTAVKVEQAPGVALFMPAFIPRMGALGAKVVTVFGKNPAERDLPAVLGTIILLDTLTGLPVCIMEAGFLTAMRTAGASGVATKYLARRNAKVHALFGTGVQARTQASAVAAVRKLERCLVFSIDPPEQQRVFADWVGEVTHVPTAVAASAREAVEQCDVLTLATSAANPVIEGRWIKPGTHINGIGSHAPAMREIDAETVQRSKVVCDLLSACQAEAGDLMIPVENGQWSWERVHGDLGQVVRGDVAGRESDEEITLFKSVGLAVQDMSVAHHVYLRALEEGAGTEFAFM